MIKWWQYSQVPHCFSTIHIKKDFFLLIFRKHKKVLISHRFVKKISQILNFGTNFGTSFCKCFLELLYSVLCPSIKHHESPQLLLLCVYDITNSTIWIWFKATKANIIHKQRNYVYSNIEYQHLIFIVWFYPMVNPVSFPSEI